MALPILDSPRYSLTIPSTKESITFRPFLVKEEKILLIAQQTEDQTAIINAIKDVIKTCVYSKIDVDALTTFDLEYIILNLRSKSVGEIANVGVQCTSCKKTNTVNINLDTITVDVKDIDKKVMLTDTVGLQLKYISAKDIIEISKDETANNIVPTIIASIEYIFDAEKIYYTKDSTKEELVKFAESLNRKQMSVIEEFIATTPKLTKNVSFKCQHCEAFNDVVLVGTQSFFE